LGSYEAHARGGEKFPLENGVSEGSSRPSASFTPRSLSRGGTQAKRAGRSTANFSVAPASTGEPQWATRAAVADAITTAIRSLDLRFPEEEKRKALAVARTQLQNE